VHARYITFDMGILLNNLKPIVAAVLLTVTFSLPVGAEDVATLLQKLQSADETQAEKLDAAVQAEWSKTGSASMDLLLKRGRDAIEAEEFSVAVDHFTALTDHAPDFAEGWHMRATAYYQLGLYGPAISDLAKTLVLNPENYNAIFGLGVILEEVGNTDLAYQAYTRVHAIHPHHSAVSTALERLGKGVLGQPL
jgi:Flp pilus assembly protein TadD